jgi:hypothetical protein
VRNASSGLPWFFSAAWRFSPNFSYRAKDRRTHRSSVQCLSSGISHGRHILVGQAHQPDAGLIQRRKTNPPDGDQVQSQQCWRAGAGYPWAGCRPVTIARALAAQSLQSVGDQRCQANHNNGQKGQAVRVTKGGFTHDKTLQ